MAAGDLLNVLVPGQLEIQGLLTGPQTDFVIADPGISGIFGVPAAKTHDTNRDGGDGAVGSPDHMGVRVLLIPYMLNMPEDPEAAGARWEELCTAWEPCATDVEVHLNPVGWGHVYFVGRPRGLDDADNSDAPNGLYKAIAEFQALSPRLLRP